MTQKLTMEKLVGLFIVLVVVVAIIFIMIFSYDPFVDKLKDLNPFSDEYDLKNEESSSLVSDAYGVCKGISGSACLCDSGINLNLGEDEEITISGSGNKIIIDSTEGYTKTVTGIKHCFQGHVGKDIGSEEFKITLFKKDNRILYYYAYEGNDKSVLDVIAQRLSKDSPGEIQGTFKLYRYVKNNEIYLCFPEYSLSFKECK